MNTNFPLQVNRNLGRHGLSLRLEKLLRKMIIEWVGGNNVFFYFTKNMTLYSLLLRDVRYSAVEP